MNKASVILRDSVRQTDKYYTYLVPDRLKDVITYGSYVEVPFGRGNRDKQALVTDINEVGDGEDTSKLKEIRRLIDPLPVMTEEQIALIRPLSSRYLCTMGDIVTLMVPAAVGRKAPPKTLFICLNDKDEAERVLAEGKLRSYAQINLLNYLISQGDTDKKTLMNATGATASQLDALRTKGLIRSEKREVDPEIKTIASDTILKEPVDDRFRAVHTLNDEQEASVKRITEHIDESSVFLLHGITGSGKTEVYLKCAGEILSRGGSVLYLVPEISLTPQTVNWITGRFGRLAAVLHSRLTDKQRLEQWDLIRRGQARIVVAPRSGVFAPVRDLKLIIIDEEHDSSYRSETFPRYNTRDVALIRSKYNSCPLVLGSATPSVTNYYAAEKGVYKLLELTSRANPEARLPQVIPVDMKEQIKLGAGEILSLPLRQGIAKALADKKQVLLFLNRRGFSRTLICSSCGSACSCPNCSVGMTLHNNARSVTKMLVCHYCGYTIPASEAVCPDCKGTKFTRAGIGTQQLEGLLNELYPNEKVLRMDQDTTMVTGAHEDILSRFRSHEASILIGTQMIAKGHDFSDVTVVGILGADLMINSSDYRSSERAFQLITQAAGRAGRATDPGTVYIQCYDPDNALLRYAASQDYKAFYREEIRYRQKMNLPPFKAVGEVVLSLPDEDMLSERIDIVDRYLRNFLSVQPPKYEFELYGPMPSPIYELRGRYRMYFVIKAINRSAINAVYKQMMKDFDQESYPLSFDQ